MSKTNTKHQGITTGSTSTNLNLSQWMGDHEKTTDATKIFPGM